MSRYRITLKLSEPNPLNLSEHRLLMNGAIYDVSTDSSRKLVSLSPIEQMDREKAERTARQITNRLLNRLAAAMQYCARIEPGYEYENLDDFNDRGRVVIALPATAYIGDPGIPEEIPLDIDLPGAAFLRCGDLSNDPFDSFRNYYLVVDRVGKCVLGGKGKDETVIQDSLDIVVQPAIVERLAERLKSVVLPTRVTLPGNSKQYLNNVLYKRFRCALMHSGLTSDFVPFDVDDEETVHSALEIMRGLAWQYVKYESKHLAGATA